MKTPSSKAPVPPQTPVFPREIHELRTNPVVADGAKPKKRDNIFSQSRDTREDRGERQMKTAHNPQTTHGHK